MGDFARARSSLWTTNRGEGTLVAAALLSHTGAPAVRPLCGKALDRAWGRV